MTSIGLRVVVALLALALSSSDGFALDAKPNLVVLVLGSGSDTRSVTAPGQPFSFRVGLDNISDATPHQVRLSVMLPKGLKFQTSDPAPTKVESNNHLVWEMDNLDPKVLPRFFEVTADTETDLTAGSTLEISAEAECSEGNANSAGNHASYTIYVQKVGPALIFLGSTLDSVLVTADGPATFKVEVRNAGNLPATDARLEVTLPTGVKFDKADPPPATSGGQVVTFNLGDLARAESKFVSMTVELDLLQHSDLLSSGQPLTFAFRISRMDAGTEVTDSYFEVTKHVESAGQDVAVWLMTEGANVPGKISPNSDITCLIKFANLGNEAAHKVVVALYLGPGLTVAHSEPQPTGTGTDNAFPGGVAHWDVGDLDVAMSRTVRSVVHATSIPADGAILAATITADGIDIDTTNNTASLLLHSPLQPSTLKSAQPSPAVVKPVEVTKKASLRPKKASVRPEWHPWLRIFQLILVIVGLVIFLHARRNR
jgi:uncharacterized repeat protein (TIGR01451 family)